MRTGKLTMISFFGWFKIVWMYSGRSTSFAARFRYIWIVSKKGDGGGGSEERPGAALAAGGIDAGDRLAARELGDGLLDCSLIGTTLLGLWVVSRRPAPAKEYKGARWGSRSRAHRSDRGSRRGPAGYFRSP